MRLSVEKTIRYIPAEEFLNDYLPKELVYKVENLSSGGQRVLLYWSETICPKINGSLAYFKEFGRRYTSEVNSNETHYTYIEVTLKQIILCLNKLNHKPSFDLIELMETIPWKEKTKPLISYNL